MNYELLVIGSGREAIEGARAAAQAGRLVALVETIAVENEAPSLEMLQRAASSLVTDGHVSLSDLRREATRLIRSQRTADRHELNGLGVDVYSGDVRFIDANTIEIRQRTTAETLTADEVLLACGTLSKRPDHFHADCRLVHDVESWLMWDELPRSMIVIGAGDTGLGHAILLGRLGVEVTVIDEQSSLRDLYRRLLVDSRIFDAQSLGIAFRLGDEVIGIDTRDNLQASVRLASGKTLVTEGVLVCVGRVGDTDRLGLEAAGVGLDERGRVWCDADGRTWASHIRAVGDVVGFASTNRGTESQRPDKFDRLPHIVGKRRDERLPFVRQRVGER